jgi:hypothetical protein
VIAIESHWLPKKVNGCHGKTLVVMDSHRLLMWSMVAMQIILLLCKSLVSLTAIEKVTGCYESHWFI